MKKNMIENEKLKELFQDIKDEKNQKIVLEKLKKISNIVALVKFVDREYGYTFLHLAALKNHMNVAEFLLINGADIDHQEAWCVNPLYLAARENAVDTLNFLLEKGANPNKINDGETTPLFIASEKGHKEIVEILIRYQAKVNLRANRGVTPLYLAAKNGHAIIAEILHEEALKQAAKNPEEIVVDWDCAPLNMPSSRELLKPLYTDKKSLEKNPLGINNIPPIKLPR